MFNVRGRTHRTSEERLLIRSDPCQNRFLMLGMPRIQTHLFLAGMWGSQTMMNRYLEGRTTNLCPRFAWNAFHSTPMSHPERERGLSMMFVDQAVSQAHRLSDRHDGGNHRGLTTPKVPFSLCFSPQQHGTAAAAAAGL